MIDLTVVRLTTRGLFGRRRFLLLLPLPVLLIGLALLSEALGATPTDWGEPVVVGLGFTVVLPVIALVVGASVLGSEIDNGTVVHLLAKPLPRRVIVLSKLAVAVTVTTAAVGGGMAVTGLVAGSGRLALGLLVGTAAGALVYTSVFLALSVVIRRAVLVGLVYVLVWEGMIPQFVPATRALSIRHYAVTVADRIAATDLFDGAVPPALALWMVGVLTVGATVLAIERLRSFRLAGEVA